MSDYAAPIVRIGADGARAAQGSMGHAVVGIRAPWQEGRQGRHQRSQHSLAALAEVAYAGRALPRAVHLVFEPTRLPDGRSLPVWFALDETPPLAFFAGIWTPWTCVRKLADPC